MIKKCRACCEEKPLGEFGVDNAFKDGFESKCKDCLKNRNPNICVDLYGESKVCQVCGESKDLNQFKKRKNRSYTHEPRCKSCAKEKRHIDKLIYKDGLKKCSRCQEYFTLDNFSHYSKKIESACKECTKARNKKYRESLPKEIRAERKRKDYLKNIDRYKEASKKWANENKERLDERRRKYTKNLRNTNFLVYLKRNIHSNIKGRFKSKNVGSKSTLLGCTVEYFKNHIEKQFLNWMTWENYGVKVPTEFNKNWDLDHIIPVSFAQNEEELKLLNHWSNFQPMCSKLNRQIKRDSVPIVTNIELNFSTLNN